ncbi:MAG: hypothetical protein LBF22_05505 [Deltaproteobacteria bacterium]|nr:hypothetical protein [Deltaproteobacteria bacterium]
MLEIAYLVQGSPSYDAAAGILARKTLIKLDPDTLRKVANHIGGLVFENDSLEAEKIASLFSSGKLEFSEEKISGVFYIEIAEAMFHTKKKDEQGSAYQESKFGMVYTDDKFVNWNDKKDERIFTIGQREHITYVGDAETFKKHLLALAIRNGYGKYEHTILLSDGASWIKNMQEDFFPDAQLILDLFHLKENITIFAKAAFELDYEKCKAFSEKVLAFFKASKTDEAIAEINALGKKMIAQNRVNLLNYINNNKNSIDYARYRELGYYIGNDAIDSANLTAFQERLRRPGMSWKKETGQHILTLMSKAKSDISREDAINNGIWKRDVEQIVRKKYEIRGFVK